MKISVKLHAVKDKACAGIKRQKGGSEKTGSSLKTEGLQIKDAPGGQVGSDKLFDKIKNLKNLTPGLVACVSGPEHSRTRKILKAAAPIILVALPMTCGLAGGMIVGTIALIGSGAEATGMLAGCVGAVTAGYSAYKVAEAFERRFG